MDHEILLSKLYLNGIDGIAHQCFQSYLEDRTQMYSINGLQSSSCSLSQQCPSVYIRSIIVSIIY